MAVVRARGEGTVWLEWEVQVEVMHLFKCEVQVEVVHSWECEVQVIEQWLDG